MSVHDRISAAVVNYRTPDLVETAVRTFHDAYPNVELLLIDNGSQDGASPQLLRRLAEELGDSVKPLFLQENRYHGPAMDLALRRLQRPFVFMLDSDTRTRGGGFLEEMLELCEDEEAYGCGKIVHVDKRGFAAEDGIPVLVSAFMLLRREQYFKLPPFIHHGLPTLKNFEGAMRRGLRLVSYPVENYIEHFGRGTAERFGYGLGLRSRVEYLLHRLGL